MFKNYLKKLYLKLINKSIGKSIGQSIGKLINQYYFAFLLVILNIILFIVFNKIIIEKILNILNINLIVILVYLITTKWNKIIQSINVIKHSHKQSSGLRKKIIVSFGTFLTIPILIISIFSTYFMNFGIRNWFDNKVSEALKQSISIGESYIKENVNQSKQIALLIAEDINHMYFDLINNHVLFNKILNSQAQIRGIDEAIIFQRKTNQILAQTAMSFSLSFTTLSSESINKANEGQIVHIDEDNPEKINILVKLKDYNDTYLLIGKLIDTNITNYINKTNGSAYQYFILKNKMNYIQFNFILLFISISLIILILTIMWCINFANKIVKPIKELVVATDKVKNGDLQVQIDINNLDKDELRILTSAFNRMITQLGRQQKEILTAQRASLWSDVARKVAHEIKNPLTPIQLSTERLIKLHKSYKLNDHENTDKYLNNILKNTKDIENIVSNFVNFARLPIASLDNQYLLPVMEEIIEARQLINNNIHYILENKNLDKSFLFPCDIAQITRAINNLLKNSEEALLDSNNKEKNISLSLFHNKEKNYLHIDIADNGAGFKEEFLALTNKAYHTTKKQGMGLGLSIVDRIVQDHYGEMIIGNNENGACINLHFDLFLLRSKVTKE